MAINITRNRNTTVFNKSSQTSTSSTTSFEESQIDARSALTRNPKDSRGWRSPSGYDRFIETGNVKSFELTGSFETPNLRVSRTGYGDASGYYYRSLPPVPQYMRDGCIQRALTKLKASDFNAAQSIGERKQLERMTVDTYGTMTGDVEQANRRLKQFKRNPFAYSKRLSEILLEWEYGWRPLLSDLHGITKQLVERENKDNLYFVTVASTQRESFYLTKDTTEQVAGVNWVVTQAMRGNHHCKVRLDYVKNNAPLVAFSSLGLTNPALLVWELTRLSYVVDWALPIGNYLNVLDADYGWTFKGGSMSRITRGSAYPINTVLHPMHSAAGVTGRLHASGKSYQMHFHREVYGESPLPSLPRLNKSSSGEHVFTAVALLRTALNKLF